MAIGTENEAEQTVDLAHLWRSAVEDYEKRTKKSLRLEQISNIDLVMKRTETGFKEFRHDRSKVDKVRTVFRNNMGVIQKVVNAVQMAGSASSAFSPGMPASLIFTAFGQVMQSFAVMSADYDKIVGFFDFTHRFFERLSMIEDKIPQQKPFQCCVARVFSNMLTICSVAQEYAEKKRFKKWFSSLVDGSDRALSVAVRNMEDAVNELTQVVGLTTFRTAKILGEVVQSMNENVEDIISNVTLIGKRTGTIKLDTETIIEQNSGLESKQDALLEMQKEALEKLNEQSRIFNDTVQNFGYVQMGANFGNDFQTSLLKLDVVRLRLARWGQSVGLANVDDVKSVHKVKLALENSEQVRGFLDQVLDLFADAEVASKRFEKRNGNSAAPALDPSEELDSVSASLHQKMQDLVERRQGKMELEQRKWTLYEKKNFSRLTDDISELVDGLIDLFPGLHEDQRKLCEEEVSEMKASKGVLSLLKEVAVDQDKMLSDTIAKATQSTTTYNNNVIFSGSNTGFQIGNNLGEISNVRFGRL